MVTWLPHDHILRACIVISEISTRNDRILGHQYIHQNGAPPIPHSFITLLTVGSYPSPLFYQVWGPVLRKLKLPSSTVCLLHVLRLTIKRCHLRCIIVNICLNDGGRADVLERNKNRLSLYLPSCEFSVSVEKKQKKTKKVEQRTEETTKCFRLQRAKRFTQPTTTPPKTIDGVSRCFIQR